MCDSVRRYITVCAGCFISAVLVTLLALYTLPLNAHLWGDVVWFAIYSILAELLAIVTEEKHGVTVSPVSPILWAATCVLGPLLAIIICVIYSSVALLVRGVCHGVAQSFSEGSSNSDESTELQSRLICIFRQWIISTGDQWHSRGVSDTVLYLIFSMCSAIIIVGPAGLLYHAAGGVFLGWAPTNGMLMQFILPFIALVMAAIVVEHALYTIASVIMTPQTSGKSSIYSLILRMKLVLLEDVVPVWKGQVFLIAVALLISYLYKEKGPWGFVLTAMPVLALRDFFRQWIEERAAYVNTITTLATYMQHYHPYTRGHLKRVADMSERLARELKLPAESVRHISTAGFLHDIGKIAVSEVILDKTSKLEDSEWDVIKEHPVKGAEIIGHIEFLDGIADWIRYHHKWYNGGGYPATNGAHVEIPIEAAIIATADAFDAMTDDRELSIGWQCDSCGYEPEDSSRPAQCPKCGAEKRRTYREPKSLDDAIDELRRGAGSQFHPKVVKAFLSMVEREGIRLNA